MKDPWHEDTEGCERLGEEEWQRQDLTCILVTVGLVSLCALGSFGQHSFTKRTFTEHLHYVRSCAGSTCQGHGGPRQA